MPSKPATPCKNPRCPEFSKESYCHRCKGYEKAVSADYEKRYVHKRDPFYNSPRWINARKRYRARHPLCEDCLDEGKAEPVPMKIVDHIVPIKKGGAKLDFSNLRSLCQEHHNRKTGEERKQKEN